MPQPPPQSPLSHPCPTKRRRPLPVSPRCPRGMEAPGGHRRGPQTPWRRWWPARPGRWGRPPASPSQVGTRGQGGSQLPAGPCLTPRHVPRPLRVGAVWEAGEHAPQLALCQLPADGAGGPAGLLPPASAPLLPAQHQHGLPAQCQVPAPGMAPGEPLPSWSHGKVLEKIPKTTEFPCAAQPPSAMSRHMAVAPSGSPVAVGYPVLQGMPHPVEPCS